MMAPGDSTVAEVDAAANVGKPETSSAAKRDMPPLPQKVVITPQRRPLGRQDAAFVVHALCFMAHVRVWGWHTSEQASHHPGAVGFGWFFRYLTFYSFSLQIVQLAIAAIADLQDQDSPNKWRLDKWANDLSCAVFSLANVVTIMYYIVDTSTHGDVEGKGAARPPWLGFAVHVYNSIAAWADLLLARPRTFSSQSLGLSLGLATFYLCWILLCSHFNGIFPYPFLNKLPWPKGFVLVAFGANVLFYGLFYAGRAIARVLQGDSKEKEE